MLAPDLHHVRVGVSHEADAIGHAGITADIEIRLDQAQRPRNADDQPDAVCAHALESGLVVKRCAQPFAGLRDHMRSELRAMQLRTGVTTLYVTHDQAEAFSMSDVIAVMDSGTLIQQGAPREIYSRPATTFVATFVGRTNLLSVTRPPAQTTGVVSVETNIGPVLVNAESNRPIATGDSIVIRPEDLQITVEAPPAGRGNVFAGRVRRPVFLGENVELEIEVRGEVLMSRQHPRFVFAAGDEVHVELPVDRCVVVSGAAAGVGSHIHAPGEPAGPDKNAAV